MGSWYSFIPDHSKKLLFPWLLIPDPGAVIPDPTHLIPDPPPFDPRSHIPRYESDSAIIRSLKSYAIVSNRTHENRFNKTLHVQFTSVTIVPEVEGNGHASLRERIELKRFSQHWQPDVA